MTQGDQSTPGPKRLWRQHLSSMGKSFIRFHRINIVQSVFNCYSDGYSFSKHGTIIAGSMIHAAFYLLTVLMLGLPTTIAIIPACGMLSHDTVRMPRRA